MEDNYQVNINDVPMVRVTWLDARDMETGWLPLKDIINAPLAVCQEVAIPRGWVRKIEYLQVEYATT